MARKIHKDKRIGLDIDGVAANFVQAMIDIGKRSGWKMPESWEHYLQWDSAEFRSVWPFVKNDTAFWMNIGPHQDTHETLVFQPTCYITNRHYPSVEEASDDAFAWLLLNDFPVAQVYAVEGSKAQIAKEMKLDLFVDDAPHVLTDMREQGINCWLLDRPWNRDFQTEYRIKTVAEIEEK